MRSITRATGVERTIHMGAKHPAGRQTLGPGTLHRPVEGDTLVIDTLAFEPNPSGISTTCRRARASTRWSG